MKNQMDGYLQRAERRRKQRERARRIRLIRRGALGAALFLLLVIMVVSLVRRWGPGEDGAGGSTGLNLFHEGNDSIARNTGNYYWDKVVVQRPELDVQLLTINQYSRPAIALEEINGIVIHYTANAQSSAQNNRSYFEGLKEGSNGTYASSHFIVGLEGEIIQCIPSSEISYASNSRNNDTLSIECCHPDESGVFNQSTYDSLVELVAWLVGEFHVSIDGVIRHYDVTGKECPKYYVEHENEWYAFKEDVLAYIEEHGVAPE